MSSIQEVFNTAFSKVFMPNFFHESNTELYSSFIYKITCFFGLPNTKAQGEKALTWARVFKNFMGWPSATHPYLIVLVPLIIAWNVLGCLAKLVWMPFGFFLEFVPFLVSKMVSNYYFMLKDKYYLKENKPLGIELTLGAIFILKGVFSLIWILGRAISSPGVSIVNLYLKGQKIAFGLGPVLALLSMATTLAVYVFLFPLVLQAIVVHFPMLAMHAGAFVSMHFPRLANLTAQVASSVIVQKVATVLMTVVNPWASATAIVGLLEVGLIAIGISAVKIFQFCFYFNNFQRRFKDKEISATLAPSQNDSDELDADEFILVEDCQDDALWDDDNSPVHRAHPAGLYKHKPQSLENDKQVYPISVSPSLTQNSVFSQ